jgi:hypothetical protein
VAVSDALARAFSRGRVVSHAAIVMADGDFNPAAPYPAAPIKCHRARGEHRHSKESIALKTELSHLTYWRTLSARCRLECAHFSHSAHVADFPKAAVGDRAPVGDFGCGKRHRWGGHQSVRLWSMHDGKQPLTCVGTDGSFGGQQRSGGLGLRTHTRIRLLR